MTQDLHYYLKTWRLSEPKLLADTLTSKSYAVTYNHNKVVLKLFKPLGEKDEKNGAIALRCFNGHGAVKLLEYDARAHLLEYADGDDLVALVKKGEDEKATSIIAELLKKLHSVYTATPPKELISLENWFVSLFRKAERDAVKGLHSIFVRAAGVAKWLLKSQNDVRILHGDIHHENIRFSAERGWLAIDPKGVVGERTYDAANTLCNPWNMESLVEDEERLLRNATILAEKLNLDPVRLLGFTFAHACLSACWSLEDGDDPTHALNIATIIEPHIAC